MAHKLLTHEERKEGFKLFHKLYRDEKKLTPDEMARMEYLINRAAEDDYVRYWDQNKYTREEGVEALKATYHRDMWG